MVYNIEGVVNVWRDNFENISLPRYCDSFDAAYFEHVPNAVNEWCREDEEDEFLHQEISIDEVRNGLKIPQKGKAAGWDRFTTEHLVHAGEGVIKLITSTLNSVIRLEYIPENFRCVTQIPLYKGKNLCPLNVNNYRGITLLTCIHEQTLWSPGVGTH